MPDKEEKAKTEKSKKADIEEVKEEEENTFGGMPDRDLKKNLGCG